MSSKSQFVTNHSSIKKRVIKYNIISNKRNEKRLLSFKYKVTASKGQDGKYTFIYKLASILFLKIHFFYCS